MTDHGTPPTAAVSTREAEVLAAVGEHLTNADIAARLFISVRTVESHVSSLLRKLHVEDRRGLAALAAEGAAPLRDGAGRSTSARVVLPSPLTPFVGRAAERSELAEAVAEHRLVTAVGPGGVGKTRLALAVADDISGSFADGVCYVDLVPVTDPERVAQVIAETLRLGVGNVGSAIDSLLGWSADRQWLLVLDNCEHLLDGVAVVLEELLASSPRLTVLATSRARLLVPFESVFSVPGLSVYAEDGTPGDAVELFLGRASAGGSALPARDIDRVAAVCRGLDGMALAIELAAARFASLGLDGLEAGLGDRLRLLTGGPRIDDRHRSLRATLDWSFALLDPPHQAVLRRVSVFSGAFDAAAAAAVLTDWPPVAMGDVAAILANLADQSLVVATAGPAGTRYRALETIRQYAAARLEVAQETADAHARHVDWCLNACSILERSSQEPAADWRAAFDRVADELRAALSWARTDPHLGAQAHQLASGLGELTFVRGLPAESQERYEEAALLAVDEQAAARAWRSAAGAAEARHMGNDALRLRRAAADAARRAGDRTQAAADLARSAELINRGPGLMASSPEPGQVEALLAEGWSLAGDDEAAQARLVTAESFAGAVADPATVELIERAISLAHRVEDPLVESAALDQLTAVQLARGDARSALASSMRRLDLLHGLPVTTTTAFEYFDAYVMAVDCAVCAGDLAAARLLAERLRDLPFYREESHLAYARLIVVTLLAGDWDEAVEFAEWYRDGWERSGRPRAGNLSRGAYAAATVHGLRGDDEARTQWLGVVDALVSPGRSLAEMHFGEFFDALLLLHRGLPLQAVQVLEASPEEFTDWYDGLWRSWYAALWAEAAVLSGAEGAAEKIARARLVSHDNAIATAIIDRAAALLDGENGRDALEKVAAELEHSGCRYQWARTLTFLSGSDSERGERVLTAMGAAPAGFPPNQHPA